MSKRSELNRYIARVQQQAAPGRIAARRGHPVRRGAAVTTIVLVADAERLRLSRIRSAGAALAAAARR